MKPAATKKRPPAVTHYYVAPFPYNALAHGDKPCVRQDCGKPASDPIHARPPAVWP